MFGKHPALPAWIHRMAQRLDALGLLLHSCGFALRHDRCGSQDQNIERRGRAVAVVRSEEEYEELNEIKLRQLRAEINVGLLDLERGAYTDYEADEVPTLAERVKAAGRERLVHMRPAPGKSENLSGTGRVRQLLTRAAAGGMAGLKVPALWSQRVVHRDSATVCSWPGPELRPGRLSLLAEGW
jgi:hypothetical protein